MRVLSSFRTLFPHAFRLPLTVITFPPHLTIQFLVCFCWLLASIFRFFKTGTCTSNFSDYIGGIFYDNAHRNYIVHSHQYFSTCSNVALSFESNLSISSFILLSVASFNTISAFYLRYFANQGSLRFWDKYQNGRSPHALERDSGHCRLLALLPYKMTFGSSQQGTCSKCVDHKPTACAGDLLFHIVSSLREALDLFCDIGSPKAITCYLHPNIGRPFGLITRQSNKASTARKQLSTSSSSKLR